MKRLVRPLSRPLLTALLPTALLLAGLLLALATLLVPEAEAQIPDRFTNLKLLDPEISKGSLIAIMRDWSTGLGVRCTYCHVGPDPVQGDPLQGMDFASDEKATKRTARRMLELSRVVNDSLLRALPTVEAEARERSQEVSCHTCHRGQPRPPRNLIDVLTETALGEGVDAALARYETLRAEHHGTGRYDFSPATLNRLAAELSRQQRLDEARQVLRANLAHNPDSADTHALLGTLELRAGNLEAAAASFDRALELAPENPQALQGKAILKAREAEEPPGAEAPGEVPGEVPGG